MKSIEVIGSPNPLSYSNVGYCIQRGYHPYARFHGARAGTFTTANTTQVYLARFVIPGPCIIKSLSLLGTATVLAGSNLQGKVRLYDVDMSNGRPTTAISEEKLMTFGAVAYDVTRHTFATPVVIPKTKHIIIASIFDPAGWTAFSFTSNNNAEFGGDETFVNRHGEYVTAASLTYASGLPADFSSVASPTWTSQPFQLDWTVFMQPPS